MLHQWESETEDRFSEGTVRCISGKGKQKIDFQKELCAASVGK